MTWSSDCAWAFGAKPRSDTPKRRSVVRATLDCVETRLSWISLISLTRTTLGTPIESKGAATLEFIGNSTRNRNLCRRNLVHSWGNSLMLAAATDWSVP